MKKNQYGFGVVTIVIALLVIGAIGGVSWRVLSQGDKQNVSNSGSADSKGSNEAQSLSSNSNESAKITTVKGTKVNSSFYYAVQLKVTGDARGNIYYGKIAAIGSKYIRISPAYYTNNAGTLVLLGKELQAPEPAMYVSESAIESVTSLESGNAQLLAIQNQNKTTPAPAIKDASPSQSINEYIKPTQYQAVFFSDGKVFFGKAKSVSGGDIFKNAELVFYLTKSGNQVSLSKATAEQLSAYTTSSIAFWENMKNNGQISESISTYIKQN